MPDLDSLRRRLAVIDARLGAPGADAAERDALKGDIILLFREADQAARQFAALKEEVKELVARWKALPPVAGPSAGPTRATPLATPPRPFAAPGLGAGATTRVDHLGASTFVAKGWSAISAGDFAAAEAALLRALDLAPGEPEPTALLGWAIAAQGRADEAVALLEPLVERAPADALLRVSLGYAYLGLARYGEAIEHLARGTRADADRKGALYAHFYLGLVYLRREMYDDAVGFFRRALALGPNLLEAYHEMGRAHWLGGDRAAAVEAWRAGAAASKFNPWAKRCDGLRAVAEAGGDPLRHEEAGGVV